MIQHLSIGTHIQLEEFSSHATVGTSSHIPGAIFDACRVARCDSFGYDVRLDYIALNQDSMRNPYIIPSEKVLAVFLMTCNLKSGFE